MSAFTALVIRDMRLSVRVGGGALMGALFFLIVVTMMPFALGPDMALLSRIGPAILWLGALLASLLALDRLFATDHDDGSLDLLMMGRMPLELAVAAKAIAHWLTTALPLIVITPVLGLMLNVELRAMGTVALTLLAGTPALTFIGLIGAAAPPTARRLAAGGIGAAAHYSGADFRRRRGQCRHCRTRAIRPTFHHSLRLIIGEPGAGAGRRRGGASARPGMTGLPVKIRVGCMMQIKPIGPVNGHVVPAAWLSMMGWGLMSVAALGTLVWRHPLADVAGKAAAPIGAAARPGAPIG